jgi:hypothetical protein
MTKASNEKIQSGESEASRLDLPYLDANDACVVAAGDDFRRHPARRDEKIHSARLCRSLIGKRSSKSLPLRGDRKRVYWSAVDQDFHTLQRTGWKRASQRNIQQPDVR